MRHVWLAAIAVLAAPGAARADELTTALGEPVVEVAHRVDIELTDGVATYRVQRQFRNPGTHADEMSLDIDLPPGAAATGLRIRARGRWYDADLVEHDRADARYHQAAGASDRPPVLLAWRWHGLHLQLSPVRPGEVSTVEYTLTVPTRYATGRYWLAYPRAIGGARGLVMPALTVHAASAEIDGKPAAARVVLTPAPAGPPPDAATTLRTPTEDAGEPDARPAPAAPDPALAAISIAAPPIATWLGRFGQVVASREHAFTRLEVDVAPQLSPLPRRAQVVFVVDASYSVGPERLAAQLDLIRAYLGHVPDAEVEVIVARRHATRRFGGFVPAGVALAGLTGSTATRAFALGNGSAIDEAAALAARILVDRTGPRRVVITTDERFRAALTPAAALAALDAFSVATIVHLVVPGVDGDGPIALTPLKEASFAALATRHHGIHVGLHAARRGVAATVGELAPAVLGLVRPTRIDQLTVSGVATDATTLGEGEGLRVVEATATVTAPTELTLAGRLWSDPIELRLAPRTAFSRRAAALMFGGDDHEALSPAEALTVAVAGGAVSPVTSYVTGGAGTRRVEPGPFADELTGVMSGIAGGSIACAAAPPRRDPDALIDPRACEARVKPAAGWRVALELETTDAEIVDVIAGADDAMTACLVEAAWNLTLDPRLYFQARDRFTVVLRAR